MLKLSTSLSYRCLHQWSEPWRTISSFPALFPHRSSTLQKPYLEIWSDASGKGYGGHLGPQSNPSDVWQQPHAHLSKGKRPIEYAEANAVLLSLKRWKKSLRGKTVYCHIDNYSVYQILSRRYSPSAPNGLPPFFPVSPLFRLGPVFAEPINPSSFVPISFKSKHYNIKHLPMRKIFDEIDTIIFKNDIQLRARWVRGKDNVLADRLSRIERGKGLERLTPKVKAMLSTNQRGIQSVGKDVGQRGKRNESAGF
nr:hypothetical protein L203_04951 [Cryptococcus depauperatus CBS 7841]